MRDETLLNIMHSDAEKQNGIKSTLYGQKRSYLLREEVLSELFFNTTAHFGNKLALHNSSMSLTYGQLSSQADTMARLIMKYAGPGSFVSLWMPRGPEVLVSQLAIAKAGAAWVPFDADVPVDRLLTCMRDAKSNLLLTTQDLAVRLDSMCDASNITVIKFNDISFSNPGPPLPPRVSGASSSDPAYLIYTSGTTGTPKGIIVTQRNVCHYLRAVNEIYALRPDDVMFQGASLAFDLSVEEVWLPFLVGASLCVATTLSNIDSLADALTSAGVTAIDTVPTLLGMIAKDIPSLKLIILGGEALPATLLRKWSKPGRRIFNTYGPTETTIVATTWLADPSEKVSIGRPIPNYSCYVVDEYNNLQPPGATGELLIGGPGVTMGYLARPDLTKAKFIENTFRESRESLDPILYRTGDAVSYDAELKLLYFHGRIDDQVKIRGFRVELGEIESHLETIPGILRATVVMRRVDANERGDFEKDQGVADAAQALVAFLEVEDTMVVTTSLLRKQLGALLPPYMVPSRFEILSEPPRLAASGKVDRKALKAMPLQPSRFTECVLELSEDKDVTDMERVVAIAAKAVFSVSSFPLDVDIFTDMGAHSLLVSLLISAIRRDQPLLCVSFEDVYQVTAAFVLHHCYCERNLLFYLMGLQTRTLRKLAERLESRQLHGAKMIENDNTFIPVPFHRRFLCGLAQLAALPFIISLHLVKWVVLVLSSFYVLGESEGNFYTNFVFAAPVTFVAYTATVFGITVLVVALKWLIIGRTRPGRYPLWGFYYFRIWLVNSLLSAVDIGPMQRSPLYVWYLRCLGASIGRNVFISGFRDVEVIDLLAIGDDAVLGEDLLIANAEAIGCEYVIGQVSIGAGANIGTSCVLCSDTVIGNRCKLMDLTCIASGSHISSEEQREGSPARRVKHVLEEDTAEPIVLNCWSRGCYFLLYVVGYVVCNIIELAPLFFAYIFLDSSVRGYNLELTNVSLVLSLWPISLLFSIVALFQSAVIRWILLPFKLQPGKHSAYGFLYYRMWLVNFAATAALDMVPAVVATVFMPIWCRLMGAQIGSMTEVSTFLKGNYDLIAIGDDCFIADEVFMGEEEIVNGWVTLSSINIGNQVFIGNSGNICMIYFFVLLSVMFSAAVIPSGSDIGHHALVGVMSTIPSSKYVIPYEAYFGSPPFKIQTKKKVILKDDHLTFRPSALRYVARALFEIVVIPTPMFLIIIFSYAMSGYIYPRIKSGEWGMAVVILLISSTLLGLISVAFMAAIKWCVLGRYVPSMHCQWSLFAITNESFQKLFWGIAVPHCLEYLAGTPMLVWVLRLFGCKIGHGVYIATYDIPEFDCVEIGNHCTINQVCLQTHTFEDRVGRIGMIKLGRYESKTISFFNYLH